ncbi:MAG: hypothetical protein R2851_08895 [Caldilineaceae bacterium]
MQIDWFTYIAQIVNFLVLVALLYRFLYGPVMRGMAAREEAIAERFRAAEEAKQRADEEADRYRRLEQELAQRKDELVTQAAADADARRKAMVQEAREEVEAMASRWYEGVAREQDAFLADARDHLADALVTSTRRALADLADEELEYKLVDHFIAQLRDLPDATRHALVASAAAARNADDVVIRSAFAMPYAKRQQIIDALQELVVADAAAAMPRPDQRRDEISVHFDVNPELLCGIELLVHDRRVAWSVRDYVAALQHDLLHTTGGATTLAV